ALRRTRDPRHVRGARRRLPSLCAARPRHPDRAVPLGVRLRRRRLPRRRALSQARRREPGEEHRAPARGRGGSRGRRRHSGPGRTRLAALAPGLDRPDPGHEAGQVPRGERRRGRPPPHGRPARPTGHAAAAGRQRARRAISGRPDAEVGHAAAGPRLAVAPRGNERSTAFPVSILLIAIGAVLAFAVKRSPNGIDIHTVGWILMAVGFAGVLLGLLWWDRWGAGYW